MHNKINNNNISSIANIFRACLIWQHWCQKKAVEEIEELKRQIRPYKEVESIKKSKCSYKQKKIEIAKCCYKPFDLL